MESSIDKPFSAHHPLGASTGFLEKWRGQWDELLARAVEVSSFAAEFAALSEREFAGLLDFFARRPHLPFIYLSVHAPVKDREISEEALVDWLRALPPTVETIVMHPDTLDRLEPYRELGRRLVVENMDDRKSGGRTPNELASVFDGLPEAGFCFDIAHAWSLDPTMELAHHLLDRFAGRLRQVHLSSLVNGKHAPVSEEHERLFLPLLERCRDVPWILEAAKPDRWNDQPPWLKRAVSEYDSVC
jgi:hypothetical protein